MTQTSKKTYRAVTGVHFVSGSKEISVPAGGITDQVPATDAKWMAEQGWLIDAEAQWPPEDDGWLRAALNLGEDDPIPGDPYPPVEEQEG